MPPIPKTGPKTLTTQPPPHEDNVLISYPLPHVLLVTLNRPKALNSMNNALRLDLDAVFNWFEKEPDLWVAVITGAGRAFCAGADLKSWKEDQLSGVRDSISDLLTHHGGFGALSRRNSAKPIIAAVNGHALGGGTELVLNCDLVVASDQAKFGLPEVNVGVVAAQGGIPRLVRVAGHQRASELALTGRSISATEARDRFGFVNEVRPGKEVLPRALELAKTITSHSPDGIRSTKRALNDSSLYGSVEEAWRIHVTGPESRAVYAGENILEGLKAFVERRRPKWVNPKL